MPKKCIVSGCKTGYTSHVKKNGERFSMYRFPKDPETRRQWISVLPNHIEEGIIKKNQRVCAKHFLHAKWKACENGSLVPDEPPNHFPDPIPKPRGKTKTKTKPEYMHNVHNIILKEETPPIVTGAEKREVVDIDTCGSEMPAFNINIRDLDALKLKIFHLELSEKVIGNDLGSLSWDRDEQSFTVLSKSHQGPVHDFTVFFRLGEVSHDGVIQSLSYEAYRGLDRFEETSLNQVCGWSQLDLLFHTLRTVTVNASTDTPSHS